MAKHWRCVSICFLVTAAVFGCTNLDPIPKVARAGTSFSIVLVADAGAGDPSVPYTDQNDVGFGGTLYETAGLTDHQRGELVFYYMDGANEIQLETQFVTRVFPDPATEVAIDNPAYFDGNDCCYGQVLAVVYIPPDVPSGAQEIRVRKKIPVAGGGYQYTELYFPLSFMLEILPASETDPTDPLLHFGDFYYWYGADAVVPAYPNPKLLVKLPGPPSFSDYASAAHIEISVPSTIAVRSVFEENHFGRNSMVSWSESGGVVTIDFLNLQPTATVHALAIAYAPLPASGYERIEYADISTHFDIIEAETTFWDASGDELQGATASLGPIR